MSHELRTPMNAILGFTRLVMRRAGDKLPQQQFDNLKKILISSEQLLELINDILDLSRVEAGHVEINRSDIDAANLAEECLRIVEPLLKSEKVTLIQQIEAELPLLHNDRDKLRQVLINLLSNAVKFTQQGSIRLSIEHREEQHQGGSRRSIIFRVSDTGIGIPDDALERVFEEFHQVDSSSTRQYGGTGLGLSIARRLTHLIGGEIGVVSKLGQGSTFTVTLPL
jgi:signal transduction histidine kinase